MTTIFESENRVRVYGLGHRARHGKNYLAKLIRKEVIRRTDVDCIEMTFAADLKAVARAMFGMKTKNGRLLQSLGTEIFRAHVNANHWVDCLLYQIEDFARDLPAGEKAVVIIPDMRFPNEMEAIKRIGGKTIRVTRYNEDGTLYLPNDGRDPNHPSETALDGAEFDYVIEAKTGDFDTLQQGRDRILNDVIQWADPERFYHMQHQHVMDRYPSSPEEFRRGGRCAFEPGHGGRRVD